MPCLRTPAKGSKCLLCRQLTATRTPYGGWPDGCLSVEAVVSTHTQSPGTHTRDTAGL